MNLHYSHVLLLLVLTLRFRRFKDMEKWEMKCGVYYDCLLYTSLAIEIKEISLIVFLTNICNLQQGY